jgi:hypothetical protein
LLTCADVEGGALALIGVSSESWQAVVKVPGHARVRGAGAHREVADQCKVVLAPVLFLEEGGEVA